MDFQHFIFRQYRRKIIRQHELNYLFWECTRRCNLNCLHCGSDCSSFSQTKDMPLEDFIKVLDDVKAKNKAKYLTVCITGGEPLLRSDLEQAGEEITRRGFFWGIATNAMLLTKERFDSLTKAGMRSLSLSFDGFEEEHNYLRQNPKSYENACNALKFLVEYEKNHDFIFDVVTCVHKGNLEILPKLRDDLIHRGLKRWMIYTIFPEGRARKNDLSVSASEYKRIMDFIVETRSYRNPEGKSIDVTYPCEGYLGDYELKVRDYYYYCSSGINTASIMCDGSCTGCLCVRSKDFVQGNIYDENKNVINSFMDIWNTKYQIFRNRSWAKQGKCKNCKKWKFCLGGGIHLYHDINSGPAWCNYELVK